MGFSFRVPWGDMDETVEGVCFLLSANHSVKVYVYKEHWLIYVPSSVKVHLLAATVASLSSTLRLPVWTGGVSYKEQNYT